MVDLGLAGGADSLFSRGINGLAISGLALNAARLSVASLSQPISASSADLDDAIMESLDTELFEGYDGAATESSGGGAVIAYSTSSQFASCSSAALACLAQGFSRLPDRGGGGAAAAAAAAAGSSACCGAAGVSRLAGGGGCNSASAATGGSNSIAGATLTEALRYGGGGGAAATAAPGGGESLGWAVGALALKQAGVSHDGAMTGACSEVHASGSGGGLRAGARGRQDGLQVECGGHGAGVAPPLSQPGCNGGAASTVSTTAAAAVAAGEPHQHIAQGPLHCGASSSSSSIPYAQLRNPPRQQQQQQLVPTPGWSSSSGTWSHAGAAATAAGSCSSSASTVHPALAQAQAGSAKAAAGASSAGVPRADLNPPLPISCSAMAGRIGATGGGGCRSLGALALAPAAQSLSWDLGPIGPSPVAAHTAAGRPMGLGLAGSIAAAAFRSVSNVTGHPSLAVPYGGGNSSAVFATAAASAASSLSGAAAGLRGSRLAVAGTADVIVSGDSHGRQALSQDAQLITHPVPWPPADMARESHGRRDAAALLPPQLFDVLPDITDGTTWQDDGAAAAAAAAACTAAAATAGDGGTDAVSAAVRALLRLDKPFDLPFTQKMPPPPEYVEALRAPSATPAVPDGVTYAPLLPPVAPLPAFPLPASVVASLEPSGVPAVDRYLHQLLQDTSAERHVFLCKRPLGPAACRAVGSCLRMCTGVKSITLSYCGITCEGAAALCEGLSACRDLLVLDLSYNVIGDDGAAALAACLAGMPLLASLTLAGNADLTNAAVAALAVAARGCGGLRRVGLRGTAASPLAVRELTSLLAKRSARRGSGTSFGGPVAAAVAAGGGGERPLAWDGTVGAAAAGANDSMFIAQLCGLLRTLVHPALAAEQAVAEAVAELMAAARGALAPGTMPSEDGADGGGSDLLSYLADGLTARGYDVAVTHALGGGSGGECLRNLRHTFLAVSCPLPPGAVASGPPSPAAAAVKAASLAHNTGSCTDRPCRLAGAVQLPYHAGVIIVDPELREQFEVAMPTARYEALVSALPRVYVGAEERLPLVVEVLCDELALALRSKGMVIPPWRESAAMISKWQPKQSKLLVPGAVATATAGCSGDGDSCPAFGSGSISSRNSVSAAKRVSLAGGVAAAAATAGSDERKRPPMAMQHWRQFGASGAVGTGPRRIDADGGGEPSLGPAPSLGSASGAGSFRLGGGGGSSLVQSFGFRRCTSTNSLSVSVGLQALAIGDGGGAATRGGPAASAAAARTEGEALVAAAPPAAGSGSISFDAVMGLGLVPEPGSPPSPPRPRGASAGPVAAAAATAREPHTPHRARVWS